MARPTKTQEERDEFNDTVARLREKGMTHKEIAAQLGVSEKTIQRAKTISKSEGRMLKAEIPKSQAMRDEIFDRFMDTFAVQRAAIRRTERLQDALEREMGFKGEEPCECCGRYPLKTADPLKWQAAFKGAEAVNAQVTTLAKMQGQMADNMVIIKNQIDEDLMLVIEEVAKLDKAVAIAIHARLIERSEQRRNRMPEFGSIVEGEYRLLTEAPKRDEDDE